MLHTLQNKIQRVNDLITEYDDYEDRCRNPNPGLHEFVQKLKAILNLNAETEITRSDGANSSNRESNRNGEASASSSSSLQMDIDYSEANPKIIEALGNHVVLTELFKFVNFRNLKNFRLVNKQWKGIANSAIIQRRLCKLSINDLFPVYDSSSISNEALLGLNDLIEASGGSFPLTTLEYYDVDYYNYVNSPALLRFYALVGPSIKHLVFDNFGSLSVSEFQDLLVNQMPNVDHIDAGMIFFTTQEEECFVPSALPSLKTIRFIDNCDFDPDEPFEVLPYHKYLLRAAPKLKEIQDFKVQLTDIVVETEKMNCIQTFNFDLLELESCSALCVQFSYYEPKLTSLTITRSDDDDDDREFMLSPELAQSLARILMSSNDTLKHLECLPRLFSEDSELPKFPNLEFLTIDDDGFLGAGADQLPLLRVFPARCDFSEIFPNLHTVSFDMLLRESESDTVDKYFPDQVKHSHP